MAHHRPVTKATTSAVKYRPSAVPMVHCAALRSGAQLRVDAPRMDASDTASKGPIIQGMGVRSQTHTAAASQASARVPAHRNRNCADIRNFKRSA